MSPNTKNILILALAFLMSGLVIVWILFVNKGTLTVSANPPFSVFISPLEGGKECLTQSCSYKVKPDSYEVSFQKSGYFEKKYDVTVNIFEDTQISHDFVEIPTLRAHTDFSIPQYPDGLDDVVHNLDDRKVASAFLGEKKNGFKNLFAAKNDFSQYQSVSVSPYFHYALFTDTEGNVSLYDIEKATDLGQIEALSEARFAWSLSEKYIYFVQEKDDKQILSQYSIADKKTAVITSFLRPIENMRMYPSMKDDVLIVAEINDEETLLYQVDLKQLRKKRVMTLPNLAGWKWSPDSKYAVYQVNSTVNESPLISVYNTETESSRELQIPVSLGFIEWINTDELVIVANALLQEYLAQGGVENLDSLSYKFNLASDGINVIENDIVMIYHIENDSWKNLTLRGNTSLQISDLMVHPSLKSVWILSRGVLYSVDIL